MRLAVMGLLVLAVSTDCLRECGNLGDPCCHDALASGAAYVYCYQGAACQLEGNVCVACGHEGEACCATQPACEDGNTCATSSMTCLGAPDPSDGGIPDGE
jgi:hypothetical protein